MLKNETRLVGFRFALSLLLFCLALPCGQGQRLSTLLGGSISWQLDDDFEISRNVTFTMKTVWDRRDFAYQGTGVSIAVGNFVFLPDGAGVTHATKFGRLKIMMGDTVELYDNNYVIFALDGDIVEGWLTQTVSFPDGAYSGNATIVDASQESLARSQVVIANGETTPLEPNGGLEACPDVGPAPTPCEKYMDGGSNPNPLNLFTSITIPRKEERSKWLQGRILNRNSPSVLNRYVMYITSTVQGRSNEVPIPIYDRDGDKAVNYPGLTTQSGPGTTHLSCSNAAFLTSYGCNGPNNQIDGPPYDSVYYLFKTSGKTPSENIKFYYSFTLKTTDGTNMVTTEIVINFCKPEVTIGGTQTLSQAPEMVTLDESGNIVRSRPAAFLECRQAGPCTIEVHAAKFDGVSGTTPDASVQPTIAVDGPMLGGNFTSFTYHPTGLTTAVFVVGNEPNGTHGLPAIGSHKVFCFVAMGHTPCRSPPQCHIVKIRGESPFFLPPTPPLVNIGDDLKLDEDTPAPVCAGFTVSFVIKAADPDAGEMVRIMVNDATGDGQDLFSPPYSATKLGEFNGSSPEATVEVSYTLDYETGVLRDPISRAITFAKPRRICSVASDNTRWERLAYGNPPDGDYRSPTKCHEVSFSGPPVFITTAHRYDGSPFNAMDGTVDERALVVDAWANQEKSITLRAQDPNADAEVHIQIMNDPGIPNGAVVGPSECESQILPVPWNVSGVFSRCSVATRTITWTARPTEDFSRLHRICAISRDSTPLPTCATDKMTTFGWYGEEHCVDIRLVAPDISWTHESELAFRAPEDTVEEEEGPITEHRSAFVPCDMSFLLVARDSSTGRNNTGALVDSPYIVEIFLVGDVPSRVQLNVVSEGRESRSMLVYAARRGDEGRADTVCFSARDSLGMISLPPSCVTLHVRRCVYCIREGDTMERVMMELALDFNWLRLWAANGNDDGDPDTVTAANPDALPGGRVGSVAINVGSIYTVERGDSLVDLAALFQTTVKEILSMNPDVEASLSPSLPLHPGQELCIIPCTKLPLLPDVGGDVLAVQ